jgi:hypothetical protein
MKSKVSPLKVNSSETDRDRLWKAYPGQDLSWEKGGDQESMEVILAVTHYVEDMESEEATSWALTGVPLEQ